jgi:N-acetylneuraminic acid mutarotase
MNDFWEWDQITNLWTRKANFPGRIEGSAVSFSIGTKGYIGTGDDFKTVSYTGEFWEYDLATDSWTQKASFPATPRGMATGFSIGNKGYIGTGFFWDSGLPDLVYYNDFWEYDQDTDTWTRKADFEGMARSGAVGFSIGNKGYIGMGSNQDFQNNTLLKDLWEWDQETNVWTQKADFAGIARQGAVGFSLEKSGYIGTGWNNDNLTDFWEWNQVTDTWTQKVNFGGIGRPSGVGLSIGIKGYVVTGYEGYTNVFHQDFWEFEPSAITGLEEMSSENNIFYPNPASDFITLNTSHTYNPSLTLNIYNISGELIHSAAILQNQQKININGLSNGIYIAEFKSKGGLDKKKLIVQR